MDGMFWKWAFFVLFVVWFLIRIPYGGASLKTRTKTKKRAGLERFLLFLNYVSMVFLPLYVVFYSGLDYASVGLPQEVRWLGVFVYAVNLPFFLWCHKSLGKNWSPVLEVRVGHRMITDGPYKWIRHPMYLHFWLLIISQGLVLDNGIVLVYGVLAWGALYFLRVPEEEKMLVEEFGNGYREYMKRTARLIPGVY